MPDLSLEEAEPVSALFDAAGLDLVLLAAPTTPPERLARIAERTRGFLYFVSVTGITGARAELPEEAPPPTVKARAPFWCRASAELPEPFRIPNPRRRVQ